MFPDIKAFHNNAKVVDTPVAPVETKNYESIGAISSDTAFIDYLSDNGYSDLAAYAAITMYKKVMPFFTAVDRRAESFAQIPIRVRDRRTGVFLENHPALDLLQAPNADLSQIEFLEQYASYFDITGDSFLVASGRLEKPPLELATIGPQLVDFSDRGFKFGMLNVPDYIRVNRIDRGQISYPAKEIPNLGLRFYSELENSEVWHTRAFNPTRTSSRFCGMSKAQPLWLELQQFVEGNINNLSNLQRGTRVSMAWVNNRGEELTETQWARMQEEAQKYSGSRNAGGTPILDGMDVKPIQQSNRDLEFDKLMQSTFARIANAYKIPLALLLPNTMTMDNLKTSMLQMFDDATLPLANRLYNELTRFLMPRYKGSEYLEFAYNENDIPALRQRILESAKMQSDININTPNELRAVIGDKPLSNEGNTVLIQSSMVPLGFANTPNNTDTDEPIVYEEDTIDVQTKNYKLALYEKGFSHAEVKAAVKEHFGISE